MEVTPRLDRTAATRYVRRSECFRAFLSATRRDAADAASSSSEGTGAGAGAGEEAAAPDACVSCGTKHVTVSSPRRRGGVRVNGENGRRRAAAKEGSARQRAAAAARSGFLTAKLAMVARERPAAMASDVLSRTTPFGVHFRGGYKWTGTERGSAKGEDRQTSKRMQKPPRGLLCNACTNQGDPFQKKNQEKSRVKRRSGEIEV